MAVCSSSTMSRAKLARHLLVAHGVAAIFHHDDLLVVALHVRQRLGEDARLLGDVDPVTALGSLDVPAALAGRSSRACRGVETGLPECDSAGHGKGWLQGRECAGTPPPKNSQ